MKDTIETFSNKFGIYDMICRWLGGSISLSYYVISVCTIKNINIIDTFNKIQGFSIVIFFIVAYFTGSVFHELGKTFYEYRGGRYEIKTIYDMCKNKPHPFWCVSKLFENIEIQLKEYNMDISISKARAEIKFTPQYEAIEKYHSYYGMSRGLSVSFLVHSIMLLVFLILSKTTEFIVYNHVYIVFFIVDCVLWYVFSRHSYRYYLAWIKNTIIVYAQRKATKTEGENNA